MGTLFAEEHVPALYFDKAWLTATNILLFCDVVLSMGMNQIQILYLLRK